MSDHAQFMQQVTMIICGWAEGHGLSLLDLDEEIVDLASRLYLHWKLLLPQREVSDE